MAAAKRPALVSVRYQDAIRFSVENKLADVGVTASSSEVKEWKASGHRLLAVSRSIPITQFIVRKRTQSQVEGISTFLQSQRDTAKLNMPDGYTGFDEAILIKAGEWRAQGAA